jgi:hypothetical protein
MLLAGLTDELLTGMPTRWNNVSTRPIGMPGECRVRDPIGRGEHGEHEEEGQDDFHEQRRAQREAARRVVAVPVRAEALVGEVIPAGARLDDGEAPSAPSTR